MEQELIGVIAACAVCGFFGIIIAIFFGCYCGKRLEKKREEEQKASTKDWVNGVSPLHGSQSGYSDGPQKLSTYQPKILGKSISQEQLIRENSSTKGKNANTVEHRESKRIRRFSSSSDIHTTEIDGRNVSVVNVRNSQEGSNGQYVYGHPSQINGGYVVAGYMVGNHIYPENPVRRSLRQGQIVVGHQVAKEDSGVLVRGHHVTANNGQLVKGHYVTNDTEVVRGHIVAPSQRVTSHVIKQNVAVDNDGEVVVTLNNNNDAPQLVQGHRSMHVETVQQSQNQASFSGQHQRVITEEVAERSRALVVPTERRLDEDLTSRGAVTTFVEETSVSPITTTTTVVTEERVVSSSEDRHAAGTSMIFVRQEDAEAQMALPSPATTATVVVESGAMTNVQISSEDTEAVQGERYKVIRRHHEDDHAKLPRWMTDRGEENQSRSLEFDDEEGGSNVIITDTGDVTNFGVVSVVNTGIVETNQVAFDVINNSQERDYIIEDFVDPEPKVRQTAVLEDYSYTGDVTADQSSSMRVTSSTYTTTQVTKSSRQLVDESAERVPPAFTSTPRVPAVSEQPPEAVTTFVVGAQGMMVEEAESRRQRVANDGSLEYLPPPLPTGADVRL